MAKPSSSDLGRWQRISGDELETAFSRGEPLEELVLECQALYLWRRCLVPPSHVVANADLFAAWIEKSITLSIATVQDCRLNHFAEIGSLSIRSAPLSPDKRNSLRKLVAQPHHRTWLKAFLQALSNFAPALYVGETSDLPARIRSHLGGESGFGIKVAAPAAELMWADLDLHYYPLKESIPEHEAPEAGKAKRTLLETIVTAYSLAGFVDRRG